MNREDITRQHPQYRKHLPQWKRCRDVIEGSDAVKKERERYLARPPGMHDEAYDHYLERAIFFNVAGKTLELYLSLIFSKTATVHGFPEESTFLEDCDLQGNTLEEFLEQVTEEVLTVGRCGVLVDYVGVIQNGMSLADAEREEARPYLVFYPAESIINWKTGRHGGKTIPDRIVLREPSGENEDSEECQYRELMIEDGHYIARVWKKQALSNSEPWTISHTIVPLMHGEPLRYIPFFFIDAVSGSPECHKPPLLDLVDINLGHYRTMADLEHGRFHSGLPTPIFAGFNFQQGERIKLGSTEGICSNMPDAKAYYLEFSGKGLEALERAAQQKEAWMVQLGAGLIDSYQKSQEAAQTLMIRRSGANATIGRIAMAVSESMSKVLKCMATWAGMNAQDVNIQLTTEYLPEQINPQEIAILLQAVQTGNYRRIDWLYRLKNAGIMSQDTKPERIDAELGKPSRLYSEPSSAA